MGWRISVAPHKPLNKKVNLYVMKIVKKKDIETHFNIYALQFIAVSTPLEVKKKYPMRSHILSSRLIIEVHVICNFPMMPEAAYVAQLKRCYALPPVSWGTYPRKITHTVTCASVCCLGNERHH